MSVCSAIRARPTDRRIDRQTDRQTDHVKAITPIMSQTLGVKMHILFFIPGHVCWMYDITMSL